MSDSCISENESETSELKLALLHSDGTCPPSRDGYQCESHFVLTSRPSCRLAGKDDYDSRTNAVNLSESCLDYKEHPWETITNGRVATAQ